MKKEIKKIVLNTDLVRAVEYADGELVLFIRLGTGQWVKQRPYTADLRGMIGALTLALDALAGKIIPTEVVELDERMFNVVPKTEVVDLVKLGEGKLSKLFKKDEA